MKKSKKPVNRKVAGRQRLEWPVLEGIGLVASMLRVPEALIKAVKKTEAGSKAFLTHNRIDMGILIPLLFTALAKASDLPEGVSTPQNWLAMENAKIKSLDRQQKEKELMPTAEAKKQNGEAWGFVFESLNRLCDEGPPEHAGRTAVELHARYVEFRETMRRDAQKKFEEAA